MPVHQVHGRDMNNDVELGSSCPDGDNQWLVEHLYSVHSPVASKYFL